MTAEYSTYRAWILDFSSARPDLSTHALQLGHHEILGTKLSFNTVNR